MGGRGAGRGKTGALIVKMSGSTQEYREKNGVLLKRSISGTFIPAGGNQSLSDLVNRAKEKGYEYQTLSPSQVKKYDEAYKKSREEANKQLDILWYRGALRPRKGWKGH